MVDANIPMYAAGTEHPNKAPSIALLEKVAGGEVDATIDTETLQEILHRYRSLERWDDGKIVYDMDRRIFPVIIPISIEILDYARILLDEYPILMARDALHAAVVEINALEGIYSYDRDFDQIQWIRRFQPPI
ncbi:MAG: type II toxin-antitoxin system VapC family toxin [bacterium]|nr:type II toxin-antitoxin system VapC family toxin [bacterium]